MANKTAAQTDRCVKHYLKERLRASTWAGAKRGGLKGAQCVQEKNTPSSFLMREYLFVILT
jgi:hypothetical protein